MFPYLLLKGRKTSRFQAVSVDARRLKLIKIPRPFQT